MKILGRDLKSFYVTGWPSDNWYVEGDSDRLALDSIADDELVDAAILGYLEWQGDGDPPLNEISYLGQSVASVFRRWLKAQTRRTLLIEFDAAREIEVHEAIKAAGAKVVRK